MSEYKEIVDIARASLMPDFFAVRIDEEKLFGKVQEFIGKVQLATPMAQLDQIKELAVDAANAAAFVDGIKAGNLWQTLREIMTKVKVS